jgi:ABC-type Mn2+/Zn2+ transport system ATPase subunit
MEVERPAKCTVIIGGNGTGKTTLLHEIIKIQGEKTLVVTPDDVEWRDYDEVDLTTASDFLFDGIRRHIFNPDKKKGTLDVLHYFKKGVIVFDDCKAYLKAATDDRVRQLLIRRRQRMVDVFIVAHGFNEVPPVFFTFATDIILFRTSDNIVRRKDCLKDFDRMVKLQNEVNNLAKTNSHAFKHVSFID